MFRREFLPFAVALGALAGCTTPIEPPLLSRRQPLPIERIALGPTLDRPAVERIVDALAEGLGDPALGRDLRDAVSAFYSDDFAGLRDELERVVFEEADDRAGLLALLERRAAEGDAFVGEVRRWRQRAAAEPWRSFLRAVLDLAGGTATAPLAEKSLVLLEPRWAALLPRFPLERDDRLPALFREVATLLGDQGVRKSVFRALERTLGGTAAPALVEAMRASFASSDAEAFAFARALERSLRDRYEADDVPATTVLEALLRLFNTLDRPSEGLFAAAERALVDDPSLRHLAASLVRVEIAEGIGRATARAVLEDFSPEFFLAVATEEDPDGTGFQLLFGRVLDGFQQVLGPVPGERDVRYGSIAPGRFLPCYALARWYQAALRASAPTLRRFPAAEFEKRFLALPLDVPAATLVFGKEGPGGERAIDPGFEAALKKLSLQAALPSIRAAIAGQIAPSTATLPETRQVRVEEAFVAGVKAWDRARPLADAFPTVRVLLDDLARAPSGWLADWEVPNLWNGLHVGFRSLPEKQVPRVRKLLFEHLKLQSLSPSARELVAKLFEKATDGELLVARSLRDLGALARFVEPVVGEKGVAAEPLVFYRRLLGALPETAVDVPGRWFRVAHVAGLGSESALGDLPVMHHWLGSPKRVVRAIRWVAEWPPRSRWAVLGPVAALFPAEAEEGWLEAFRVLASIAEPLGAVAAELVDEEGRFHGGLPATDDERAWLAGKARDGAWVRAGAPLLRWLRGGEASRRLLPLARRWAEDGTWARLFEQLQWVKDARLARWARCLARWEALGVLRELLRESTAGASRSARP